MRRIDQRAGGVRRGGRVLPAALAAAALCASAAACSSSVSGQGSFGAGSSGTPIAGRSAHEILDSAQQVSASARSVRMKGVDYESGTKYTVDLRIAGDKTCKGTVAIGSESATNLVIVDGTLYYSTDKGKSYKKGDSDASASKVAIMFCSRKALAEILKPAAGVQKKGTGTVDGQKIVTVIKDGAQLAIKDDSGSPFLVDFTDPSKDKSDLHFSDWNQPVSVHKPSTS